jgi:hypothetical protein
VQSEPPFAKSAIPVPPSPSSISSRSPLFELRSPFQFLSPDLTGNLFSGLSPTLEPSEKVFDGIGSLFESQSPGISGFTPLFYE